MRGSDVRMADTNLCKYERPERSNVASLRSFIRTIIAISRQPCNGVKVLMVDYNYCKGKDTNASFINWFINLLTHC